MSATFRERFEAMVESLRADSRVEVLAAELMPPATPAALKKAELATQRALPPAMRAFYEAHNGVFLRWGLKGRKYPKLKRFELPDGEAAPGCVNMLPVERAMSFTWQKESLLNEIDEDCWEALFGARFQSFSKRAARLSFAAKNIDPDQAENNASSRAFEEALLKFDALHVPDAVLIDPYSKNNMAALLLGPIVARPADGSDKGAYRAEAPLVIKASDGGSDMISNGMSFEVYLDALIASYGADRGGFEVDDDPKRIKSWKKKPVSVKKIVDAVFADSE